MAFFVVYFGLALFILTISFVQVDSDFKRYISVISDVHVYYGTSSVFFVISHKNRCFEDYNSVYSLSRDFSRRHDYTSLIQLDQVDESKKLYRKRKGRYLLVIFLQSLSDIDEFAEKFKSYIWLVIFTNESDSSEVCEYCKSPKGNSFRLRFDTEMLVLCCDSLILKDWWSIDGTQTEISDFALSTDKNRHKLKFLASAALHERRHQLKGAGIRIGLVEGSQAAYEVGDRIRGYYGDILSELKRSMNFTIAGIVRSSGYGNWDPKTNNWTESIGEIVKGEFDLGVADFTITSARLRVIEYTLPLAKYKNQLYIKDQGKSDAVYWTAYFKAFSRSTWIVTVLLIALASILLAIIKLYRSFESLPSLMLDGYLSVWGIFCQQGLADFPVETSLRVAYFSLFIMNLIIYATYSGLLISFLTVSPSYLTRSPFTTLEGFVKDGSYRLIVYKNAAQYEVFANTTVPLFKRMMKLMKPADEFPESSVAASKQICQGKVGLYTRILSTTRCKLMAIDSGYENTMAMIFPAGSQYTRVINYHIQRFKETGLLDRLQNKYQNSTRKSVGTTFVQVDLWDVAPVLATLSIGILFALIVLLGEVMSFTLRSCKSRSKQRRKSFWDLWRSTPVGGRSRRGQPPNNRPVRNKTMTPTSFYG